MAFVVRCPHSLCRRPKRVDGEHSPQHGDPVVWCKECRIRFAAWVDKDGVPFAVELPPGY